MEPFLQQIEQQLAQFSPFLTQQAVVFGKIFSQEENKVSFFVEEIRQTAQQLRQQQNVDYAQFYADRLLKQFDALKKAISRLEKKHTERPNFHSSYRFPRNVHSLPKEKRLVEYRKALRALNEKLGWLSEAIYGEQQEEQRALLQAQLAETEFRKQRCLVAIDELEDPKR
ncbi:primosomal replication protein N [Haemophilus paracuniculus]|uniref:Primosomal replication protein N n=1 Tax=Haemophilus paracuniculus TaxID=734 RepID=A0A1T0AS80_9PAST|nr:primosomal replication protein PriC [Haemophilus paracuniculus]OOR99352.1 primosomal replication protein N [Haemophilus paracuniculus]